MPADQGLSVAERRALMERRLDELDRVLLGLLPRADRLAVVVNVEARLQALGDVDLPRALAEVAAPLAAGEVARASRRSRRSRLAYTSGVVGIIAAGCLLISPLVLVIMSMISELLGETLSILLFGMLMAVVMFSGGLAVFGGGVSLLRLARRDQSATGTGWAITGLCTGALPMLVSFVGVLWMGSELLPTEAVQVTWSATGGPVTTPAVGPVVSAGPVPLASSGRPVYSQGPYAMPVDGGPLPAEVPTNSLPGVPTAILGTPGVQDFLPEARELPALIPESKPESKLEGELLPSAPAEKPTEQPAETPAADKPAAEKSPAKVADELQNPNE